MYRMSVMAMMYVPDEGQTVDKNKLVRLALIHDMAECIVGDITPFDGIPPKEKHEMEVNAMTYLGTRQLSSYYALRHPLVITYLGSLLPEKTSEEFKTLFNEYESQESIESKIVKEFDLFDVMLQAFQYEQREYLTNGRVVKFQEFFDNAFGRIKSKHLLKISEEIDKNREEFWSKIESNIGHN